jgi:hypothetical protein
MAGKSTRQPGAGLPAPLTVLYQRAGLPAWPLPPVPAGLYGGDLGFRQPCVYANFVASIDGVTALGPEYPSSGSVISGHAPADRFVMGPLRACADVVLIGAGTLRATPGHRWTPAHVCPAAADGHPAFRRGLGRDGDPCSASSPRAATCPPGIPRYAPARSSSPRRPEPGTCTASCRPLAPSSTSVTGRSCRLPRCSPRPAPRGGSMVLTEGGPRLLGQLAVGGLLDQLFLTVSPVLAGRGDTARPGLIAGLELLPGRREPAELLTVRRHGSYLFLRYAMRGKDTGAR